MIGVFYTFLSNLTSRFYERVVQEGMPLSSQRIKEIEDLTQSLLITAFGNLDTVSLPVDLSRLLEKQHIQVKFGSFQDDSVSGAYDPEEQTIFVSSQEPFQRQNFTIAHEIGHDILHDSDEQRILFRRQILDPSDPQVNQEAEQEANWFAASLLMPGPLLQRYWQMKQELPFLCSLFGVSESALKWRLKNLGLKEA